MFADLPSSSPRALARVSSVFAVCSHGAIIAVAVWASAASAAPPRVVRVVQLPPLDEPRPVEHGEPLTPDGFVVDGSVLQRIRVQIPEGMSSPPIGDFGGAPAPVGSAAARVSSGDGVWNPELVDQRPEVLAGPPLTYPELLRQAGVEGRVTVRAVVDTLGRVEVGSASIVISANPGFDGPALAYVRRALFRPARVLGRAVRVLVDVPIDFRIVR